MHGIAKVAAVVAVTVIGISSVAAQELRCELTGVSGEATPEVVRLEEVQLDCGRFQLESTLATGSDGGWTLDDGVLVAAYGAVSFTTATWHDGGVALDNPRLDSPDLSWSATTGTLTTVGELELIDVDARGPTGSGSATSARVTSGGVLVRPDGGPLLADPGVRRSGLSGTTAGLRSSEHPEGWISALVPANPDIALGVAAGGTDDGVLAALSWWRSHERLRLQLTGGEDGPHLTAFGDERVSGFGGRMTLATNLDLATGPARARIHGFSERRLAPTDVAVTTLSIADAGLYASVSHRWERVAHVSGLAPAVHAIDMDILLSERIDWLRLRAEVAASRWGFENLDGRDEFGRHPDVVGLGARFVVGPDLVARRGGFASGLEITSLSTTERAGAAEPDPSGRASIGAGAFARTWLDLAEGPRGRLSVLGFTRARSEVERRDETNPTALSMWSEQGGDWLVSGGFSGDLRWSDDGMLYTESAIGTDALDATPWRSFAGVGWGTWRLQADLRGDLDRDPPRPEWSIGWTGRSGAWWSTRWSAPDAFRTSGAPLDLPPLRDHRAPLVATRDVWSMDAGARWRALTLRGAVMAALPHDGDVRGGGLLALTVRAPGPWAVRMWATRPVDTSEVSAFLSVVTGNNPGFVPFGDPRPRW